MSNPFQTQKFKALAKLWDKKLIKSGHEEIEDFSLPDAPLIRWHKMDFGRIDPDTMRATMTYYDKARSIVHTYNFKNPTHKLIWELHAEGKTCRGIADQINKPKYRKSNIFNIIKKIHKDNK